MHVKIERDKVIFISILLYNHVKNGRKRHLRTIKLFLNLNPLYWSKAPVTLTCRAHSGPLTFAPVTRTSLPTNSQVQNS